MQAKPENVDVQVANTPKSDAPASKTGDKHAVCLLYYLCERLNILAATNLKLSACYVYRNYDSTNTSVMIGAQLVRLVADTYTLLFYLSSPNFISKKTETACENISMFTRSSNYNFFY